MLSALLNRVQYNREHTMRTVSLLSALLLSLLAAGTVERAHAGLFVSITVAPPPLVVYDQPPLPGPGYIWTPGYWSWDDDSGDYYWVPGAWVLAPEPGLLWTPGYWGWRDGVYVWNAGYWGPHVGFYGGINYGYGYGGVGFAGGYWQGGVFAYNRSVANVGVGVSVNVYSKTVINRGGSQVSFNGGNGGVRAQPTAQELAFAHERHIPPSAEQLKHQQFAAKNPDLKFSHNHGKPAIAATARAGDFSKGSVFGAKSRGSGFKPASLKTQGSQIGGGPKTGPGGQHFGSLHQGTPPNHPAGTNNGKTAGTNFSGANRFHQENQRNNNAVKGATLHGPKRPGTPPPHPGSHPAFKQPSGDHKQQH